MHTIDPDKLTPIERAELSVLAGIIRDNDRIDECLLSASDFYNPLYGKTYDLMQRMRMERKPIDAVSLGVMDKPNSAFYWEIDEAGEARFYDTHLLFVIEWSTRRKLTYVADGLKQRAMDPGNEVGHLIEEARKQIELTQPTAGMEQVFSGLVVDQYMSTVGKGKGVGYMTPWEELDKHLKGLRPGALYVLGARPGVGKSAIALQFATLAEQFGYVGFFTLEMSRDEVAGRIVTQQAEVASTMLESGNPLPSFAQEQINEWRKTYPSRMLIDDRGTITMPQIRAQIRAWSKVGPLSLIVVDYLQLISGPPRMNKLELVTMVSRELKLIAKDFKVPVMALSQLNRNSENRTERRPTMSDLRESGSIEQDADVVLLLYREDDENPEELEMIIAKSRQGPSDKIIKLQWQGEFVRAAV